MTIFTPCKGPWEWALWESGPCWGLPCGGPYSHKALTPGLNLHLRSSISFIGLAGVREVRHTQNHPMNTRVTLRLEAKNLSFLDLGASNEWTAKRRSKKRSMKLKLR